MLAWSWPNVCETVYIFVSYFYISNPIFLFFYSLFLKIIFQLVTFLHFFLFAAVSEEFLWCGFICRQQRGGQSELNDGFTLHASTSGFDRALTTEH